MSAVLKEFKLDQSQKDFLLIKTRKSGLWSWFLSKIGLDPITSLVCNKQSISFNTSSVRYGKRSLNVPITAVTAVSSFIYKPFPLLLWAILFLFLAFILAIPSREFGAPPMAPISFLFLIVGVVFVIFYFLNKSMGFAIYNGGDKSIANITFKSSVIEGQKVTEERLQMAADAINDVVLNRKFDLETTNI